MTSMKIVQFSRPLTSLVHLRSTFLHPLDLGRPISNEPSPPFPNDNQSVKRKQFKDDYYMLSGTSFWSAFVFIINSLILSGFSLASFIQLTPHYLVFRGFIPLCLQLSKNTTKYLLFVITFQYLFCNQLVLFAKLENVNKLWNNNRTVHENERNRNKKQIQVTSHSN